MEPVTWVFVVIAALVVFVIAAVVIGREAHRLDAVAPRVVYRLDEAVDYVAEHVPPATQARLTPAEVEQLLIFHLRWLHAKGLQPIDVVDRRQDLVRANRHRRGHADRLLDRRVGANRSSSCSTMSMPSRWWRLTSRTSTPSAPSDRPLRETT